MKFLLGFIVAVLVLVLIAAGSIFYLSKNGGISARAEPGKIETGVALRLRNFSIPADAKTRNNPFSAQGDAWRQAVDHYGEHCSVCHGPDGKGETEIGKGLYPRPPDLTKPRTQDLSDGDIFYIIENGVRFTGMPSWGEEHTPEATWKLVSLIRHFPQMSPEEVLHMQSTEGEHEHHEHPSELPRTR